MTITRPEVPVQLITPDDVRESIRQTRWHLGNAAARIAWQVEMEAWVTLGYSSWGAMREAEYGGAAFMVPSKSRPEIVRRIKEIEVGKTARGGSKHLTDQEIADTAGVSRRQVQDDLHENNEVRTSAQNVTGTDDDVIDAEIVEDEEHEPRPRRRRPITDAFWTATYDLRKRVESVHRLTEDDRFSRNAATLAGHRNDLIRQRDLLTEVIDRIPEP
ncbi:hypothetical protein [Janibacter hoylei]|uniref:hypothetical protein n=1 Tax=Janibacter hoylei TaxID=364298 RepID=UPI0021A813FC|nr:hypothetical protein [Janibacter hoylei]MCT1618495.1 hypothetical protein [Janibacter hoylei]MCT2294089.1 hypothetical protein [Janibacter hoylei]